MLPRDRLLWLAMVVEIAAQRVAAATSTDVELAEVMVRALPGAASAVNLPAVIEANWRTGALSIEKTFESLGLHPWEAQFLRPALEGMSEDAFFRVSTDRRYGIALDDKTISPWTDRESGRETHVQMVAASDALAGTQLEVEADRQALFGANLINWLLAWGNRRFQECWVDSIDWFSQALAANMPNALNASCVTWRTPDFQGVRTVRLYTQHPKRKMTHPMCFFNKKLPVTRVAHIVPASSADFVDLLGLTGEADLPEFLRGWSRDLSWTTSDANPHDNPSPFGGYALWSFCPAGRRRQQSDKAVEATVFFNDASLPHLFADAPT